MPITAFNSHADGLEPSQRSREHFITNLDLDDDRLWVPYAEGIWFQPCSFNVTSGGYLEHDWIAKPGTYIYEPAGEAHTLVITDDSPEPMMTLFVVGGGLIYLDKPSNGNFAAYEDGFTLLELTRQHYRDVSLDPKKLDALIR